MGVLRLLMSLAVTAMLAKLAIAANHTVGGPTGWDTSSDLKTWASSQSFLVGDNLIFQYSINHDVNEVTKTDYDSCQATNPIQTYSGGNTVIPLSSPGKRYFICGTIGHCGQGMKVEIDSLATSTSSPESAPTSSLPPETSTSPTLSPKVAPSTSHLSPTKSPVSSPSISSSASSTNKGSSRARLAMGFGFVVMILLAI